MLYIMLLWVPQHVTKRIILEYIRGFDRNVFSHVLQDKINSRYPSHVYYKIYVDDNFEEIDTTCSICFEPADFQLSCGHIFHRHCIGAWKKKRRTCPMCRASL